jgi:hypothetical protein
MPSAILVTYCLRVNVSPQSQNNLPVSHRLFSPRGHSSSMASKNDLVTQGFVKRSCERDSIHSFFTRNMLFLPQNQKPSELVFDPAATVYCPSESDRLQIF